MKFLYTMAFVSCLSLTAVAAEPPKQNVIIYSSVLLKKPNCRPHDFELPVKLECDVGKNGKRCSFEIELECDSIETTKGVVDIYDNGYTNVIRMY